MIGYEFFQLYILLVEKQAQIMKEEGVEFALFLSWGGLKKAVSGVSGHLGEIFLPSCVHSA